MDERSSMRGQVAVVTGGGAGIGLACAERFAEEGAREAVLDGDPERGAGAVARVEAGGAEGLFQAAEATSEEEARAAFRGVMEKWGRMDALVNCAGGFYATVNIDQIDEAEWDAMVDWNLKGAYLCCREAAGPMKAAGYGRIVNVSSLAGRTGIQYTALHYATAKAALLGFTRRLAVELAPHGVTVNAVAPGVVLSPRVAELHKHRIDEIRAGIPMGREAEAEEIADGIWYLATPGASYITGVSFDINGGMWSG
ncbi:MAG: SDR family NAD(P)-dependent oxidoreductase [bacterium]